MDLLREGRVVVPETSCSGAREICSGAREICSGARDVCPGLPQHRPGSLHEGGPAAADDQEGDKGVPHPRLGFSETLEEEQLVDYKQKNLSSSIDRRRLPHPEDQSRAER